MRRLAQMRPTANAAAASWRCNVQCARFPLWASEASPRALLRLELLPLRLLRQLFPSPQLCLLDLPYFHQQLLEVLLQSCLRDTSCVHLRFDCRDGPDDLEDGRSRVWSLLIQSTFFLFRLRLQLPPQHFFHLSLLSMKGEIHFLFWCTFVNFIRFC